MRTAIKVVSLKSARERRQDFTDMAEGKAPVSWAFFDACTGLSPLLEYDPSDAIRKHGRELTPGELGCYSSHFEIWHALTEDAEFDQYVVLEDDVVVNWPYLDKIIERNSREDGFDYLRLFWKYPSRQIVKSWHWAGHDTSIVQLLGHAFGTQGYVIRKEGARRLKEACEHVSRPIDDQIDRSWSHRIDNLAVFPPALFEMMVPSSIASERSAGEASRSKPSKSGGAVDAARRLLFEVLARLP
ncbi:glycosyltransferase family 25 protein [Aurantiacibacter marinus]|uniref:glycosyltransferase family 25 protein n=1 Tax=Aurantiacibacter marinus TaxID=874156 RepID=UPI00069AFD71|nr:glycosyltransferase family 25 protein [Aurantiacibacter marinus]